MFIGLLPLFGPLGSGGFINPLDTITALGLISSNVSFAEIGILACPDSLTALGFLHPVWHACCCWFSYLQWHVVGEWNSHVD